MSLLPSATEIVYALGLGDELAGVTFECDFPPEAPSKPVVSNTSLPLERDLSPGQIDRLVTDKVRQGEHLYEIDEKLVRLIQPNLILAQDLCRVCAVPSGQVADALEVLGCHAEVVSLDPSGLDDIFKGIEEVGRATGRADGAERLASGLRARVARVRERTDGLSRPITLALEWSDPPFVGGHWVPEMVSIAGGRDVLGIAGRPSRRLSWEDVVRAEPEVVVFMPCGYHLEGAIEQGRKLFSAPGFAELPATRAGRVFAVDASSYFSRPGPRIVDGLEMLAWAFHPEAFPEPPPGRVTPLRASR